MLQLIGNQRLFTSAPRDADRYTGGYADYPKFILKLKTEVLDVPGITAAEKFLALQQRVSGDALEVVGHHIYEADRGVALTAALKALAANWELEKGIGQECLNTVLQGKEPHPDNEQQIQRFLWELQRMRATSKAMKDDSFLALEATVHMIVDKRFGRSMKLKFAKAAQKQMKEGEKVDVDFLIKFVKDSLDSLK